MSCLVVSACFYCFLQVGSAPQRDVHDLNKELEQRGFKPLCSVDDFKASLTSSLCGITLRYLDKAKAVRLIKRHANEKKDEKKDILNTSYNIYFGECVLLNGVGISGGFEALHFFISFLIFSCKLPLFMLFYTVLYNTYNIAHIKKI